MTIPIVIARNNMTKQSRKQYETAELTARDIVKSIL